MLAFTTVTELSAIEEDENVPIIAKHMELTSVTAGYRLCVAVAGGLLLVVIEQKHVQSVTG